VASGPPSSFFDYEKKFAEEARTASCDARDEVTS
jgi:hypothetical protein